MAQREWCVLCAGSLQPTRSNRGGSSCPCLVLGRRIRNCLPGAVDTDLTRHMLEFVAWFSPALALRLGDTLIPLVTWHPREASLTQL